MPKYLIEAEYTAEGLRGVIKDKASGRKAAVEKLIADAGGKLEAVYFGFGVHDVFVLCDCPNNVNAASLALAVSSSGLVRTKTIPLLTVEEMDQAIAKHVTYRGPGT